MDYIEYTISLQPRDPWAEILSVELTELGFESFVQEEETLLAYLPAEEDKVEIQQLLKEFSGKEGLELKYTAKRIEAQNWNAEWENSFEPVFVEGFCNIRAPFHAPEDSGVQHEIVIMPKMSFGTGHHPTTYLMAKEMSKVELKGMNVLDMGCGTGVLGILAMKCGAKEVLGIDIEEWAVENASENAVMNEVEMEVKLGSVDQAAGKTFDVVLANINRNVLSSQLSDYVSLLNEGGELLLSGFMEQDVEFMRACFASLALQEKNIETKENWVCIRLFKK